WPDHYFCIEVVYTFPKLTHLYFKLYGHHRDLHSFPTRRSSDLPDTAGALIAGEVENLLAKTVQAASLRVRPVGAARAVSVVGELDRKSTRLNSSHVKISYAVFCLKKKKIHN